MIGSLLDTDEQELRRAPLGKLAALARASLEADTWIERRGQIMRSSHAESEIAGLSAWARPGDMVELDGSLALVDEVDRARCRVATDRPPVLSSTARLIRDARPEPDASWLGRRFDHALEPTEAQPRTSIGRTSFRAAETPAIRSGIAAIDALAPLTPGELRAVAGGTSSARTLLLWHVAAANADAVVVLCPAPGRHEMRTVPPNAIVVSASPLASRAERLLAIRNALISACSIVAQGAPVVALVDAGALSADDLVHVRRDWNDARRAGAVVLLATCTADTIEADARIVLSDADLRPQDGFAIDLAATLAAAAAGSVEREVLVQAARIALSRSTDDAVRRTLMAALDAATRKRTEPESVRMALGRILEPIVHGAERANGES